MLRYSMLGLALLLTSAGCGSGLSTVSGTISVDGKPAENIVVAFVPEGSGTSAAATTDASGKYTLSSNLGAGLPEGKYKVALTTARTAETSAAEEEEYSGGSDSDSYASAAGGMDYAGANEFKEKIPAQYNSQTTLTADVVGGSNTFDFDVATK